MSRRRCKHCSPQGLIVPLKPGLIIEGQLRLIVQGAEGLIARRQLIAEGQLGADIPGDRAATRLRAGHTVGRWLTEHVEEILRPPSLDLWHRVEELLRPPSPASWHCVQACGPQGGLGGQDAVIKSGKF